MTDTQHTPGLWDRAADSYGKVRHSRKACVYTTVREPAGDRIVTVAARIDNWADARLIAAAPELLDVARLLERTIIYEIGKDGRAGDDESARSKTLTLNYVRAVIAKATA